MKRIGIDPREGWRDIVASQGLLYHSNTDGSPYWDETAFFEFAPAEIERLERAANELHGMFLQACRHAVVERLWDELDVPENLREIVSRSWRYDDWELYGRFDFTFDADGTPKLLEYNADTPTGLVEASLIQWFWKEAVQPNADQFNSIHEALLARWRELITRGQIRPRDPLYLTSVHGHTEDRMTVGYLGELANQAGLSTRFLPVNAIGWDAQREIFVDLDDEPIRQLCKLYPWEWLGAEPFSHHLRNHHWQVLEPPWKVLCTSKGMLLVLDELFPDHPNLLPVSRRQEAFSSFVRKPFWGREGHNVEIVVEGNRLDVTSGPYRDGPSIFQQYSPLLRNGFHHAQAGVWMVGPEARGMGVREDDCPILRNSSRFVPHVIA